MRVVWSWGRGRCSNGELGHGDTQNWLQPNHIVAVKERVVAVSTGGQHSLALTASGTVYSWGQGAYCQLGHGDEGRELPDAIISQVQLGRLLEQLRPKRIVALKGSMVAISAGSHNSLALVGTASSVTAISSGSGCRSASWR